MKTLVGDIGGTNARLALVALDGDDWRIVQEAEFESQRFDGLVPIVSRFVASLDSAPERACFAVACPVIDGRCRLPNLGWELEADALACRLEIAEVGIINDFDAVGHALRLLGADDLVALQEGTARERAPIALIGAGTGLGHGFLTWQDDGYAVHSSEGGHADFAPRTELECRLLRFLQEEYGRASYERVVSGPGLFDIYRFLAEIEFAPESPETLAEMREDDPSRVISQRGLAGTDRLCVKALDMFTSAYGAQAGNLALTLKATGGVYVAGGIAPALIDKMTDGTFVAAFRDKGRLSYMVEDVPVRVIMNTKAGLLGAAAAARGGEDV